ncbi:P-loop containing nucleoside triphosphate hydrolase protein [Russula brevipes]|nr:P-loop containing nucleoside triphosphate hydrolase protein [Russula brevipes]
MAIAVFREAASLASKVPYMGAIAGIFLQIIRIKDEVDLYREVWEEAMYNVVKVVELVMHFSASCQRHGLCDEEKFPQNFVGIIKELESEFVRVADALLQCRGRSKFEQFKMGLARNDVVREIQRCDRHMNRMFERFMAAMVVDIRFQQLYAERAQSTALPIAMPIPMPVPSLLVSAPIPMPTPISVPVPSVTIVEPQSTPHSLPIPHPQISEPATPPSSHIRQQSAGSSSAMTFPHPIRPQVFFGRDAELKRIVDLIFSSESPARVAILGPGGVGKTALAHAVLTHDRVVSRFGDSRYLIPCESLTSQDALLVALADRLSLLQPGTTSDSYSVGLESRVLSVLASEVCILCLDDFESPWDQPGPSRRAVELLLADITALPSVTVLVTMRGSERPKETAWTLPMLPPLTNFGRGAAKRAWECLAGTYDEWAEKLIDAVDCLPLAVTLLASLAEVSTAETLWERWQQENIALVEREKGDKLSSLEFSIALSWRAAEWPRTRRRGDCWASSASCLTGFLRRRHPSFGVYSWRCPTCRGALTPCWGAAWRFAPRTRGSR